MITFTILLLAEFGLLFVCIAASIDIIMTLITAPFYIIKKLFKH